MKEFFNNAPYIVSDNGAVPGLPTGTVEAVEKAFESGADAVFVTVRLSSDGVPFVIPEAEITGPGGEEILVAESDQETLARCDAAYHYPDREGENFPLRGKGLTWSSLKDMLFRFPENRFFIDLADDSDVLTEEVLSLLQEYNSTDRIVISSAHSKALKKIRRKLPHLATTLSAMSVIGAYFLYRSGLLSLKKKFAGDAMLIPEAIGVSHMTSRVLLQEMMMRGKAVYIWNVENEKDLKRLTDIEVDGFITANIAELLTLLDK